MGYHGIPYGVPTDMPYDMPCGVLYGLPCALTHGALYDILVTVAYSPRNPFARARTLSARHGVGRRCYARDAAMSRWMWQ